MRCRGPRCRDGPSPSRSAAVPLRTSSAVILMETEDREDSSRRRSRASIASLPRPLRAPCTQTGYCSSAKLFERLAALRFDAFFVSGIDAVLLQREAGRSVPDRAPSLSDSSADLRRTPSPPRLAVRRGEAVGPGPAHHCRRTIRYRPPPSAWDPGGRVFNLVRVSAAIISSGRPGKFRSFPEDVHRHGSNERVRPATLPFFLPFSIRAPGR